MALRQYTEKIGYYIFTVGWVYYLVNLPFQWKYIPTALGMMIAGLGWLMLMASTSGKIRFTASHTPYFRWLILFYILGLILHLTDPEPKLSAKIIGIQTPLWVWPLIFMLQRGNKSFVDYKYLLPLFFISTSASALVTMIRFVYFQWILGEPLGYRELSPFDFIPVHYLAMLYSFALLWATHLFFSKNQKIFLFAILLFLIDVLLLNARIQWLVLAVGMVGLTVFHKLYAKKTAWIVISGVAVLVAVSFALPESKRRLHETKDELLTALGSNTGKQTNARFYLWKYAWQTIKEKPWWGHRPGHADKALQASYEPCDAPFWDGEGVYYLRDRTYNYHNTCLQAWADRGFIGFAIVIISLLGSFVMGKSTEVKLFTLVFGLSFLTESMLDRQSGVFFFAFFLPLLSGYKKRYPADQ